MSGGTDRSGEKREERWEWRGEDGGSGPFIGGVAWRDVATSWRLGVGELWVAG